MFDANRFGTIEVSALEEERDIDECDHHRHFDERTDDGRKRGTRVNSKDRNRHCDCQLEIVLRQL